jgi:ABC-type branched-subunit amino acid transport system ATPase component
VAAWRSSEGELVAVVGAVGSGKSSLLAALLGDIKKNRGKV